MNGKKKVKNSKSLLSLHNHLTTFTRRRLDLKKKKSDFSLSLSLSLSLYRPAMTDFLDAADDLEEAQTREGFEEGER